MNCWLWHYGIQLWSTEIWLINTALRRRLLLKVRDGVQKKYTVNDQIDAHSQINASSVLFNKRHTPQATGHTPQVRIRRPSLINVPCLIIAPSSLNFYSKIQGNGKILPCVIISLRIASCSMSSCFFAL